jgi:hypothetical protein
MAGESKFDATASIVGYLYQCRYALYAAIVATRENPGAEISIEKFDDVAFELSGLPIELIQTKHHVGKQGSLSDASTDLWKTLRIWSDRAKDDASALSSNKFFLITTANAPSNSAASLLKTSDRDEEAALALLEGVAAKSHSVTNAAAYKAFMDLSPEARLSLLRAVTVLDNSSSVNNVYDDIEAELFHAVANEHLPLFVERLEGWWIGLVIQSLSLPANSSIPITAVDAKIDELRESFQRDALPIDYADATPSEEIVAQLDKRPFVSQLRQIQVGNRRIEWAIRDYYRAFEQRSRWAREELLVGNELDFYERSLIEAWEPRFEAECEQLDAGCSETQKIRAGQKVFAWVEQHAEFPLRSIRERFLTHGSFHILANRFAVGWHPDYQNLRAGDV